MKRLLLPLVLFVTMGIGCWGCDDPYEADQQRWQEAQELLKQQQEEATNAPAESILDDLGPIKPVPIDSTTTTPTESILNDLDPMTTKELVTSLWVKETNLNVTSSGTEAYWQVKVVYGSDTSLTEDPANGVEVTVEFRGPNTETDSGTTGADGWVTWARPKSGTAIEMYITDINGEYPWNVLDRTFSETESALAITAEENK